MGGDGSLLTAAATLATFLAAIIISTLFLGRKDGENKKNSKNSKLDVEKKNEEKKFAWTYAGGVLLFKFSDWLMGPYFVKIYESKGVSSSNLTLIFLSGFLSAMLFGGVAGALCDVAGRKKGCIACGALFIVSCVSTHFGPLPILIAGRLAGGAASSLLHTAFESWMVCEHGRRNLSESSRSSLFSLVMFCDSIGAIFAGLVAEGAKQVGGYNGPFDCSILVFAAGSIFIALFWRENYGSKKTQNAVEITSPSKKNSGSSGSNNNGSDSHGDADDSNSDAASATAGGGGGGVLARVKEGVVLLRERPAILMLGCVSCLFESSMYVFVFLWGSLLQKTAAAATTATEGKVEVALGVMFACYMLAVMAGSRLFGYFSTKLGLSPLKFLPVFLLLASAGLGVASVTSSPDIMLAGFTMFELSCGVYFPSAGTLRAQLVPENVRTTTAAIFRVPLNLIVIILILSTRAVTPHSTLRLASVSLMIAAAVAFRLGKFLAIYQSGTSQ